MCRSALDELAGRGGRGAEDDPMRLSARGLLQFLRARIREKSLAAAPADLLPASVVCQVHITVSLTFITGTGGRCFVDNGVYSGWRLKPRGFTSVPPCLMKRVSRALFAVFVPIADSRTYV